MSCELCGKACRGLISDHNPKASEWYCPDCHKSVLMMAEDRSRFKRMQSGR